MLGTRTVRYTASTPSDERLVEAFLILDIEPEDGFAHRLAAPKVWQRIAQVPVGEDHAGPQLASLISEDPELGALGAALLCGWASATYGDTAKAVAERLAAREELTIYRWNDEDGDVGGARAMVRGAERTAAVRVLPHEGQWVFYWATGPTSRLGEFGGALHEGLISFRPTASWATGT